MSVIVLARWWPASWIIVDAMHGLELAAIGLGMTMTDSGDWSNH